MRRSATTRRALFAGVVAVGLLAAACGDDSGSSNDTTATTAKGGSGTGFTGSEFKGKTVVVSGSETGTEAEGGIAGFKAFEKLTGGTVDYQGSRDFETQIRVAYEGGTLPDVALFPQPGALKSFVDNIPALPADLVTTLNENYDPIWTKLVTFDGKGAAGPHKADVKGLWG